MSCVGNWSVVNIYIIRPKPGPVAKIATPRPSGWELNCLSEFVFLLVCLPVVCLSLFFCLSPSFCLSFCLFRLCLLISSFISRFDLLPFYSRLVATLHPCMPDLADELFSSLKSEFKWHVSLLNFLKSP